MSQSTPVKKAVPDAAEQTESEVSVRGQMTTLEPYPNVYEPLSARLVADVDDDVQGYRVFDVHYENHLGNVKWTTIYVTLKPRKQNYGNFKFGVNMQYQVQVGNIWIMVGSQGKVLEGKKGEMICVPAGKTHTVMNQLDDDESSYIIQVPAKLDLRQYIGYPTENITFGEWLERKKMPRPPSKTDTATVPRRDTGLIMEAPF